MSNAFAGTVHQNKYLSAGADEVNAVVSVASTVVAPGGATGSGLVVGFLVDGSGSMSGDKWRAAKQALVESMGALPDTAETFVAIGRTAAEVVVPAMRSTPQMKAAALKTIHGVDSGGGTHFADWLVAARQQFDQCKGAIKVLVFLTDGENDEGGDQALIDELASCAGKFEVESRGVGDAYRPDQLRLIQHALGGSIDIIRHPHDLAADFAQILSRAATLAMSDVALQLWTPVGVKVAMVKQFGNEILDLTPKVVAGPNPRSVRVPTGHWGQETRDFHLVVKLDGGSVGKVGDTKLCARASIVYKQAGQEVEVKLDAGGQVLAVWTDDDKQSAVINAHVASYTGQAELADRIQEGIKELEAGNEAGATKALQRANALAEQTGHEATQKLIRKLADVDDKGTLKIKRNIDKMDVKELDTRSTRTARTKKIQP